MEELEAIIGLEVHIELKTASKMFCGCQADYFGAEPNTHTCPICLGLPGTLPVPNRKAVEWTVLLGMALDCRIPETSKFDRKHYFYPDLPKGFQISQYDQPLAVDGKLIIPKYAKTVKIRRVHLEEDTGKLIHENVEGQPVTLIDFNRSGVPLVEVVTEPDLRSPEEATEFLKELRRIVRYLGISNCEMEQGTMRLEPNVSIRAKRSSNKLPDYKVELKNINSFKFAERAVRYEIERQKKVLRRGQKLIQETRGWDEKKQKTISQRGKEEAHDYRYFPEPDIPPIRWTKKKLAKLRRQLPELPAQKRERFKAWFNLPEELVEILTNEVTLADWYEEALRAYVQTSWPGTKVTKLKPSEPVAVDAYAIELAQWLTNEVMRYLTDAEAITRLNLEPAGLAELLYLIEKGKLTSTKAKEVLAIMIRSGRTARMVMKDLDVRSVSKADLVQTVSKVIANNRQAVADFKQGKEAVIQFLVGQVMAMTKGQANPSKVKKILLERLSSER